MRGRPEGVPWLTPEQLQVIAVGYYNQPLAANGNRREGTASK